MTSFSLTVCDPAGNGPTAKKAHKHGAARILTLQGQAARAFLYLRVPEHVARLPSCFPLICHGNDSPLSPCPVDVRCFHPSHDVLWPAGASSSSFSPSSTSARRIMLGTSFSLVFAWNGGLPSPCPVDMDAFVLSHHIFDPAEASSLRFPLSFDGSRCLSHGWMESTRLDEVIAFGNVL